MDGAPSINPFTVPFFPLFPIIIVTATLILIASAEDQDTKENTNIPSLQDDNGAADLSLQPPVSSKDPDQVVTKSVAFKPSAAAIVGVLATTFCLTFLLLLYMKNCDGVAANNTDQHGHGDLQDRENSGIGRTAVDMLPAFEFGSLRGQKQGLECAVCLTGFEDHDILRLLPKCKHAFHMECVDTWLNQHSSCPLCRYKVDPDDVFSSDEVLMSSDEESGRVMSNVINNNESSQQENESIGSRRVSFVTERMCEGSLISSHHSRKVKSESVIGQHRLHHQIVLSPTCSIPSDSGVPQRWSNFETDDMLYLTSDRIISCSSSSHDRRRSAVRRYHSIVDDEMENGFGGGGGRRRNERDLSGTVSDMTGMLRILNRDRRRERDRRGGGDGGREEQERRRESVASRWWAWISRSQLSHRSRSSFE
ncbi:unnamed protein product [Lathyrus sativus]|nr:unnamed protein product [Lathyrus sativus]